MPPSNRAHAIALAVALLAAPLAAGEPEGAAAPADLVVSFHDLPAEARAGGTYEGARVRLVDEALRFLAVTADRPDEFRARAAADPRVRHVADDRFLPRVSLAPDDPRYPSMYGPQQIGAEAAWDVTLGATSVVVCIVDTGVRYTHEDLAGARWAGGRDFANGDLDPWDDHGHGTHVTGTAVASTNNGKGIAGVAQASFTHAKVLTSGGWGYDSWIASGIRWCADNGAHVVSLSLGASTGSSVEQDAVEYAWNAGAVVVAAAGNDGCDPCVGYPAAYPQVIAVACTTSTKVLCSFSSRGPEIDLAAPGYGIDSTCRSGDASYCSKSGTSMSAPHVAGAVALVKSARPGLTNAEIRSELESTAEDLGASGWDSSFGHGLVRPALAMANWAPAMASVACSPARALAGEDVTCSVRATDDGSAGIHYVVEWGDGSAPTRLPATGTVAPGTTLSATHAYAAAGDYVVTANATDSGSPPLTSDPLATTQTVVDCLVTRTRTILAGAGGAATFATSFTERDLPPGCGGEAFALTGASDAEDFDVCWRSGDAVLACHATLGPERGVVPAGADSAQIVLKAGALGRYTLAMPDPWGGANPIAIGDDDGEADALAPFDYADDTAVKRVVLPQSALVLAEGAALAVYAQSYACTSSQASHALYVNGVPARALNPCGVWPTDAPAWREVDVPRDLLRSGTNTFRLVKLHTASWSSRNVHLGVDLDTDEGRSDVSYNGVTVAGELMWRVHLRT